MVRCKYNVIWTLSLIKKITLLFQIFSVFVRNINKIWFIYIILSVIYLRFHSDGFGHDHDYETGGVFFNMHCHIDEI